MGTESEGFPPEPAYEAAAQAGHELTQQRLYEAQNLLAKRGAEIARLEERAERAEKSRDEECERVMRWALIFAEIRDFTQALPSHVAAIDADAMPAALRHPSVHLAATDERLTGALQRELLAILGRHGPGEASHLNPCTRCNGSGSEPDTDPDEAAGLVLVVREDLRLAVSALRDLAGHASEPLGDFARRLADASGHGEPSRDMATERAEGHRGAPNSAGVVSQDAGARTGDLGDAP
jgi:hypothetical protein